MPIRPIESTSQMPGAGRIVTDSGRVAGQREDVADAERMSAEQLRFERHQIAIARREVDDALEIEIVLDAERHGERAHAHARHGAVADVDDVDAGVLEEAGGLDRALDAHDCAADRSRR